MIRIGLLSAVFSALVTLGIGAQENQRVYVAYYQISYGDLQEWIADYYNNSVPVLDALVEEGVITGFSARMHSTGGEYNIRQALLGTADTDFEDFWDKYLSRLAARDPAASQRGGRMIMAHYDEIWNIDEVNIPDGGTAKYFYDAQFQVSFADLEAWNRMWDETFGPALQQAVTDGLMLGWVEESHNTGGKFNWKIITLVEDWDTLDEVTAAVFEAAPLDHPIWSMFSAHMDEIWEVLPPAGAN
jgi:hypothetical protein